MGFQIIDQGTRFPLTAGMFTTPPRRVERLQHTAKDKRIEENKDNLQEREQRENKKQKPRSSSTLMYQKTEYPHQRNSLHANQIMSSPVVTILPDTRSMKHGKLSGNIGSATCPFSHRIKKLPALFPTGIYFVRRRRAKHPEINNRSIHLLKNGMKQMPIIRMPDFTMITFIHFQKRKPFWTFVKQEFLQQRLTLS